MKRLLKVLVLGAIAGVVLGKRSSGEAPLSTTGVETHHVRRNPDVLFVRIFTKAFTTLNHFVEWHRLPPFIGALNLVALRNVMRNENLYDTTTLPEADPVAPTDFDALGARTADGVMNGVRVPRMGAAYTRFGRNVPLQYAYPDTEPRLLTPNPRTVSRDLLTRTTFQPATIVNLLAGAWLQFQVHDWFNHQRDERPDAKKWKLPIEPGDTWPDPEMTITPTLRDATVEPEDSNRPPAYLNTNAHWWDGSQIYGSTLEQQQPLRTGEDGRLKLQADGLLPPDPANGLDLTGVAENWWLGLAVLHRLFTAEHNAICTMLKRNHPGWGDQQLFDKARLINAALMAKIHTVEWTPGILANPTLQIGMRGNWWGALGERVYRKFGRLSDLEAISGIPGSPTDHHGAYYGLTEEFNAVYRMHPLLPDDYTFRQLSDDATLLEATFPDIQGRNTRQHQERLSMVDLLYSLGTSHPGAITLHNYPRFLQMHRRDNGEVLDVGSIDILRDRERGVPRYNQFRQQFHKKPVESFEELTNNPTWREEIRRVYNNDINLVDTMVGLYAEPLPPGFGFSDTAFRVFILMASRRLKSDRFFTVDYTPAVYTQEGLDWIDNNTMSTVLLRHHPELLPHLSKVDNAFAPWPKAR